LKQQQGSAPQISSVQVGSSQPMPPLAEQQLLGAAGSTKEKPADDDAVLLDAGAAVAEPVGRVRTRGKASSASATEASPTARAATSHERRVAVRRRAIEPCWLGNLVNLAVLSIPF
jgi:hypothetical protein